jgi:hypothetical protein
MVWHSPDNSNTFCTEERYGARSHEFVDAGEVAEDGHSLQWRRFFQSVPRNDRSAIGSASCIKGRAGGRWVERPPTGPYLARSMRTLMPIAAFFFHQPPR